MIDPRAALAVLAAIGSAFLLLNAALSFLQRREPILSWLRLQFAALSLIVTGMLVRWAA